MELFPLTLKEMLLIMKFVELEKLGLTHVSHSQLLKRAVYSRFQGQKIQSSSKSNQLQLQPSGLITLSHVFRSRLG